MRMRAALSETLKPKNSLPLRPACSMSHPEGTLPPSQTGMPLAVAFLASAEFK